MNAIHPVLQRAAAVLVLGGLLGLVTWGLIESYYEPRVDYFLEYAPMHTITVLHIRIDSLNPDLGKASVTVTPEPLQDLAILVAGKSLRRQLKHFPSEDTFLLEHHNLKILREPIELDDKARMFESAGLLGAQDFLSLRGLVTKPSVTASTATPAPVASEMSVIGNPAWYPFDSYMLIGKVDCRTYATWDGKEFASVDDHGYKIDFRAAGFTARRAEQHELEWMPPTVRNDPETMKFVRFNADYWQTRGFAVVASRPLFLRLTVPLLGLIALLSAFMVGLKARSDRFAINAVAYFLGLWAIRQTVTVGAPSTPNLVDYGIITLYVLMVALIAFRLIWPRSRTSTTEKMPRFE